MLNTIKGSFYTLFFILLNLVYLVIELSFNARVLDVSSSMSPSTDFGQLEIYGRTISASGATIFAWRLLVPFQASLNLSRLLIKFFIIGLIVFPLVFIGQKKLVDDLVDLSSSETRRSAEILSLLKYGIANGFVEIDELAVDELTLLTPEGKMFITLSGLLVYNSDHLREILEQKLDKIAGYAITTQQTQDGDKLYKNYRYAREQVLLQFEVYRQLVNELEQKQNGSREKAIELYEMAMNKAMLNWLQYQQALMANKDLLKVSRKQVSAMKTLLSAGMQQLNACIDRDCISDGREQFEFHISQLLGFYSSIGNWCAEQQDTQLGNKLLCVQDKGLIKQRIIQARKLTLAVQAGLSQPYESKLDYLKSMDFRANVFAILKGQGMHTRPDWNFTQHERLLDDMSAELDQQYLEYYQQTVLQLFNAELAPRTELKAFNLIDSMQNFYVQALGEKANEPVQVDLSREQFEDRYVAALYFARFNSLINKLKAGSDWYETDSPYEQSGKNSLRNLVVPAVAIAFSLLFGLLNMMNLLLNFVFLLFTEKLWLRWLGILVLSGFILLLPQQRDYKIYSQQAYHDLLYETRKNYGHWADALDWVAKTEPLVYPLGHVLRYNLLDGFNFD